MAFGAFVLLVVAILVVAITLRSRDSEEDDSHSDFGQAYFTSCSAPERDSHEGRYRSAAVSSDGVPCSSVATSILKRNGTPVDASIAAMFCIGVINAQSSGLGGGFFATVYSKRERKVYALDAREAAPGASYPGMFDPQINAGLKNVSGKWWHQKKSANLKGGLAVAVPGELAGLHALYRRFGGGVPWGDLLDPAIRICEEGYNLTWYTGSIIARMKGDILSEPSMSLFTNQEEGRVLREGELVLRKQLAKTLRKLKLNPEAFYTGEVGANFLSDLRSFGGVITKQDMANYRPIWREPVKISLQNGNFTLYSFPPPGSGVILGLALNILDGFQMTKHSLEAATLPLTHHRVIEALKFSYAQRYRMGDLSPDEADQLVKQLTSDEFASRIRLKMNDSGTIQDPAYYGTKVVPDSDHGTAHFSLVAPNGDAVAITSSINYAFGAGIRSESTGIIYNDEMADFTAILKPGEIDRKNNFVKPGKRPLSSMVPSIVLDSKGEARLVLGAAGGIKIPSAAAWVAARNLWMEDGLKASIDACRSHHSLMPMALQYEKGFPEAILEGLRGKGHVTELYTWKSVVNAVARDGHTHLVANSDYRKSGEIDGF